MNGNGKHVPEPTPDVVARGWFPVGIDLIPWLAHLSCTELPVLLNLLWHQNMSDGIARPGNAKIAKEIGHKDPRHVRRAIASLTEKGFIETVNRGDAGGRIAARRVVRIPAPPRAESAPRAKMAPRASHARGVGAESAPAPGANSAPPPRAESAPRITSIELDQENYTNNNKHADVDDGLDLVREDVLEALELAGIAEPTSTRLLTEVPGLTADVVRALRAKQAHGAGPGLLVIAIRKKGAALAKKLEVERVAREASERVKADRAARIEHLQGTIEDSDVLLIRDALLDRRNQWLVPDSAFTSSNPNDVRNSTTFRKVAEDFNESIEGIDILPAWRPFADQLRNRKRMRTDMGYATAKRIDAMTDAQVIEKYASANFNSPSRPASELRVVPRFRDMIQAEIRAELAKPLPLPWLTRKPADSAPPSTQAIRANGNTIHEGLKL